MAEGLVAMKRWTLVLFLLLLPFTMAPRTSTPLENDWEAVIATEGSRGGGVGTFVAHVWPGEDAQSDVAVFTISGDWELVSTSGCEPADDGVSCTVDASGPGQHHVLRVTARTTSGAVPSFALTAADAV